jgi:excisionase family DNA binding protein
MGTTPDTLTTEQVAEQLRVDPHTVRAWVRRGKLRALTRVPGGPLKFRQADIDALYTWTKS